MFAGQTQTRHRRQDEAFSYELDQRKMKFLVITADVLKHLTFPSAIAGAPYGRGQRMFRLSGSMLTEQVLAG